MTLAPSPFVRHLGRPVRRFSALDAFRLQLAFSGFEPVPPRGPGRPPRSSGSLTGQAKRRTSQAGGAV